MNTIITEIIIVVTTAVVTIAIERYMPEVISKYKAIAPKKKKNRLRAMLAIKYAFLAISIILIILLVPFGKPFVVSIACVILLFSYFIALDILFYTVSSLNINLEKEQVDKDINLWLSQLAKCDREDKERSDMIIQKLTDLHYQRDLL